MNRILMTPGIKKYKLMEKMLANKMMLTMGPYIESVSTKDNMLSKIPISFENLLLSRPVGVTSKYQEGLLTSPWIMSLWICLLELSTTMLSRKNFMTLKIKTQAAVGPRQAKSDALS